jgi:flagellar basal-body rod protein FlgB
MFASLDILKQAQAMATHAGARQSSIARNIANADTPDYRPTDVAPFAEAYREAEAGMSLRQTRAGHFGPDEGSLSLTERLSRPIPGATSPNGNGVSLEAEMVKSAEVKSQHDMALSIYSSALGILRTSLGRR